MSTSDIWSPEMEPFVLDLEELEAYRARLTKIEPILPIMEFDQEEIMPY